VQQWLLLLKSFLNKVYLLKFKGMSLQIIQDSMGKNAGVFIPYSEWNNLKKLHKDLADLEDEHLAKENILSNIKKGLEEVRLFENGNLKTTSAKDFLNEL
jgi:hypothetical protein